jgi:hypothetical protein
MRYFRKSNLHLNDDALFRAVEDPVGLSFAQLKGAYIVFISKHSNASRGPELDAGKYFDGMRSIKS